MKIKKGLLVFLFLLVFQTVFAAPIRAEGYSDYLDSIMDMARERYYKNITEEQLLKGALKGIFGTMDDYTTFFDIDEANSFLDTMEGNYQGIGVEIVQIPEGVMVTKVFTSSPAEGAGIFSDDRIVKVDGKDIRDFTSADVASLIKGEAGTYVELGILRGESKDIITIRVERGTVNISPVTWKADGDIMYIRLDSFSSNSSRFFEQALKEMDNRGIWKMILDLRDNPGGEVFQAVGIARLLVRKGLITKLDFKSEKQNDIEYDSYLAKSKYLPAVLVNENSASASEILASAIQDSGDGFLIGTKTFGKGVVQNIYPILTPEAYERYKKEYGQSIVDGYDWINQYNVELLESDLIGWTKITTGHYLTRDGNMIDGIGLAPDYPVKGYELLDGIDVHGIKQLESTGSIGLNGVGNDVYNAERILTLKGYDLEAPDNILDAGTCEILKQFQKEKGIEVTGTLDAAAKKALNSELDALILKIDEQYAKAKELLGLLKY